MGFWHENLYLMTPYCVSNEISNSLAITRVVLRNGGGKLEIRQKKKKNTQIDQHDDVIYFQIDRRGDIKFPDIKMIKI